MDNIKWGVSTALGLISVLAVLVLAFYPRYEGKIQNIEELFGKAQKNHVPREVLFEIQDLGGKKLAHQRFVDVFCIDGYKYVALTRFGGGVSMGLTQAREIVDGQERVAKCQ